MDMLFPSVPLTPEGILLFIIQLLFVVVSLALGGFYVVRGIMQKMKK